MTDVPPSPAPPAAPRRWGLAAACTLHAPVFLWAAWALPWRDLTVFAGVTATLGALHAAVAGLALARPGLLGVPLRALAFASFGYCAWLAWQFVEPALYVARIYGSLGQGVAGALGVGVLIGGTFTIPIGIWCFVLGRGPASARAASAVAVFVASALGTAALDANADARETLLDGGGDAGAIERGLATLLPAWRALPESDAPGARSLFTEAPVSCDRPIDGETPTVVAHFTDRAGMVRGVCVQGEARGLVGRLGGVLARDAVRGPVAVEWVRAAHALRPRPGLLGPLVEALALRPGLDGACLGNRCLTPWQLLAMGVFTASEPSRYMPQVRLGFGVHGLRRALGERPPADGVQGLVRLATHSALIGSDGRMRAMTRLRPRDVVVDRASVARSEEAAEAFLVAAQHPDGTFRYELDAYRDVERRPNPSLPRHAGVTLVACELGADRPEMRLLIARALGALARYERAIGDASGLTYASLDRGVDLGSAALGLVAFASCRERAGARHDRLIGRLTRFLLRTQLSDGRFRPGIDASTGVVMEGETPQFAGGQAIMALALVERIAAGGGVASDAGWPPVAEVRAAVERGMDFVAERYWPEALRDFFFLKENWHCAAARVAIPHHRHDGYERFCIDFVESKERMQLDRDDDVAPEFVGGLGFGNVVPPHNGSSAGMGEALAAEVDVMRARGMDVRVELARVERGLAFLLRQQAFPETCFACTSPASLGWFSGYMVGAMGRIDHIQHTWSAIGHGARVLGLRPPAR